MFCSKMSICFGLFGLINQTFSNKQACLKHPLLKNKRHGKNVGCTCIKKFRNLFQVRWADLEERKEQSYRRDLGFVVGQTQRDWERITDDTYAERQLRRTKYF